MATEVYKIINNIAPKYLQDIFRLKDNSHGIRNSQPLEQAKFNTITYGRNSIKYKGAIIWNKLPNEIKEAISLKQFKTMIKKWEDPKCMCIMCDKLL